MSLPGRREDHLQCLRQMVDETETFADAVVDVGYSLGVDMDNDELRASAYDYLEALARDNNLEVRA